MGWEDIRLLPARKGKNPKIILFPNKETIIFAETLAND
jgi:hypothetical protein